jgi:hypothetical protein
MCTIDLPLDLTVCPRERGASMLRVVACFCLRFPNCGSPLPNPSPRRRHSCRCLLPPPPHLGSSYSGSWWQVGTCGPGTAPPSNARCQTCLRPSTGVCVGLCLCACVCVCACVRVCVLAGLCVRTRVCGRGSLCERPLASVGSKPRKCGDTRLCFAPRVCLLQEPGGSTAGGPPPGPLQVPRGASACECWGEPALLRCPPTASLQLKPPSPSPRRTFPAPTGGVVCMR